LLLLAAPLGASPGKAVIEFDAGAESMLDARVTRRLVALELGDVVVPPAPDQGETALFYRVLADTDGRVRIELWERGELHGVRVVSAEDGGRHLGARRVALAAAELARRLRTHRLRTQAAQARAKALAAERERIAKARTLDGPVALRSSFAAELMTSEGDFLLGPSLAIELDTAPFGRLDVGLGLRSGELSFTSRSVEVLELELGYARRFALTPALDLDLGLGARAGLVWLAGAREVDGVAGEPQSWWVRAFGVARLEQRLTRELRGELALLGGPVLRDVPLVTRAGHDERWGGWFLGAELGLVFTPPGGR
jgi:hypothetical protein